MKKPKPLYIIVSSSGSDWYLRRGGGWTTLIGEAQVFKSRRDAIAESRVLQVHQPHVQEISREQLAIALLSPPGPVRDWCFPEVITTIKSSK